MGATNCPETPRQKMIAMMYLVYTALLALNEVLAPSRPSMTATLSGVTSSQEIASPSAKSVTM